MVVTRTEAHTHTDLNNIPNSGTAWNSRAAAFLIPGGGGSGSGDTHLYTFELEHSGQAHARITLTFFLHAPSTAPFPTTASFFVPPPPPPCYICMDHRKS